MKEFARQCQGPIPQPDDYPAETCGGAATHGFFFPHTGGIAFVFSCPDHLAEAESWAGRHFGGAFGDEIAKSRNVIAQCSAKGIAIAFPHGRDYDRLTPAPNPPKGKPTIQPPGRR